MILQLAIGGALVMTNVMIHAIALDLIIRKFPKYAPKLEKILPFDHKPVMSSLCVLGVFCSHIVQIWIWAFVYMLLPDVPLHDPNSALYFSITSMTTLGYGDIVLPAPWNTLSAIEGANGLIAFGWSTAFTFEIISQLYRREGKSIK